MLKILLSTFLSIIVMIVCFTSCLAQGEKVSVVIEEWPPFRIADKRGEFDYTGIDLDLLKEISLRLKIDLKIKRYPWARCLSMMKTGQADMITGLAFTEKRSEYIQYTKTPYFSVSPAFYLQKGMGHKVKEYKDLYQFKIGYSIGSAYFEPFNSDKTIKKHGVPTEKQLIKMLANNRLEVIIGTDSNIEYDIANMGFKEKVEKAYYRPKQKTDLYIGVSKKSEFIYQHNELNRIIDKLIKSGAIKKIAQKYF